MKVWALLVGLMVVQGCSIFWDEEEAAPPEDPSGSQQELDQEVRPPPSPLVEPAADERTPEVGVGEEDGSSGHEELLDP